MSQGQEPAGFSGQLRVGLGCCVVCLRHVSNAMHQGFSSRCGEFAGVQWPLPLIVGC
jgi:hypothetical protein